MFDMGVLVVGDVLFTSRLPEPFHAPITNHTHKKTFAPARTAAKKSRGSS